MYRVCEANLVIVCQEARTRVVAILAQNSVNSYVMGDVPRAFFHIMRRPFYTNSEETYKRYSELSLSRHRLCRQFGYVDTIAPVPPSLLYILLGPTPFMSTFLSRHFVYLDINLNPLGLIFIENPIRYLDISKRCIAFRDMNYQRDDFFMNCSNRYMVVDVNALIDISVCGIFALW